MSGSSSTPPQIAHGMPTIRGTRVPVDVILGALAGSMPIDETAQEYGISQEQERSANAVEGLTPGERQRLEESMLRNEKLMKRLAEM